MREKSEQREVISLRRWLALVMVLVTFVAAGITYDNNFPKTDLNDQLNQVLHLMHGDEYVDDKIGTVPVTETEAGRLIFQIVQLADHPDTWGFAVYEKGIFGGTRPLHADLHEGSDQRSFYYSHGLFRDQQLLYGITVPDGVTEAAYTQMNWGEEFRSIPVTAGEPFLYTYPGDGYYVHRFILSDASGAMVETVDFWSDDTGWSARYSTVDAGRVWYTILLESVIGFSLAWVLWQKKKETE